MKTINDLLIITGYLISLGISIYAAQPWGDNTAYQDLSGYLSLLIWELWIALPFVLLILLNQHYRQTRPHLMLMFAASLIGSLFAVYSYVDAIMLSSSSTTALIFIFLPVYQLLFIVVVGLLGKWLA